MDTTHGDRLIEAMPEVTPDEIRYLEYVVSSIKQGLREADRGETISVDEAKARMRWRWRARHER